MVVVRSDHKNGIDGLRNTNFCHPGYFYDKTRRWTERFLKHFERSVVQTDCKDGTSPAEIETAAFARFFRKACRPGQWSNNIVEDAKLSKNIRLSNFTDSTDKQFAYYSFFSDCRS